MAKKRPKQRPHSGRGSRGHQRPVGAGSYNASSLAVAYGYEPELVPRRQPPKKSNKILFTRSAITAKNLSFSIYLMLGLMVACLVAVVAAGSNVTIQRENNTRAQNHLRHLEVQNTRLQNQINQARNLAEIEYIARNRLGMSEPLLHQIHGVSLIPAVEVIPVFSTPLTPSVYDTNELMGFLERVHRFLVNSG